MTLSRALRLGLAVRTRPKGPLGLGLVAETGSRASLRAHHRAADVTRSYPGYRFFGLALQGSVEHADRWGFVRLEAGPAASGYSGVKGHTCATDGSPSSDLCRAAGGASTRLGRAGLMVGIARSGLPGLRRMGIGLDDRITWWDAKPRHDVQLGLVVPLGPL